MTEETAARVVELLESIDGKLDTLPRVEAQLDAVVEMLTSIKMDVSGFQHESNEYPGRLETMEARLSDIQLILESIEIPKQLRPEEPAV